MIDNENGTATLEFVVDSTKPEDVLGARITAFDPDDPDSSIVSNAFNITFYEKGQKPPGPGPTTGTGPQEPEGGNATVLIAILVVAIAGGVGWMYYRRHRQQG